MKYQEKKYRVEDFVAIELVLKKLHAQKAGESSSTHYYAQHTGNDVMKLVDCSDQCEIHELKAENGKFTLMKRLPMSSLRAGLEWLRGNGYDKVSIITMKHTDFNYSGGVVGLYVINDYLHSVIIDVPPGEHEARARELGIDGAEVIEAPYDKFLQQLGKLEAVDIEQLLARQSQEGRSKRILAMLHAQYPGKAAYDLDGRGLHFVCEVEPVSEHPNYDRAVEVIIDSRPHIHRKMTQYYTVLRGDLELHDGGLTVKLKPGDKHTVKPGNVHWAKSDEALVEIYSEPGWTKEDHIPADYLSD
ncbi:MAG TPA: cupin domain-containing protein [Candidatus Saccharimonadia bacterium]|nr:cupin domain-containing protein [Candidatus Saccharimonadia bacterium]